MGYNRIDEANPKYPYLPKGFLRQGELILTRPRSQVTHAEVRHMERCPRRGPRPRISLQQRVKYDPRNDWFP